MYQGVLEILRLQEPSLHWGIHRESFSLPNHMTHTHTSWGVFDYYIVRSQFMGMVCILNGTNQASEETPRTLYIILCAFKTLCLQYKVLHCLGIHKRHAILLDGVFLQTCSTVQHSAIQYSTVQYSAIQCSTVQHSAIQYSAIQYSIVQYSTVQYNTV